MKQAPVIVVEDDPILRDLLSKYLDQLGYALQAVEDALSALPLLRGAPYVAIVDVHLPGASGLWLADQIREISPTTAVVLATGDATIPANQSMRAGIVAYLVKPFELEGVAAAVQDGVQWSALRRTARGLD